MSDYFGALIRSSGLRIGGGAAPVEASAPPDGLAEITEERIARPMEKTVREHPTVPVPSATPHTDDIGSRAENAPSVVMRGPMDRDISPAASIATPPSSSVASRTAAVSQPPPAGSGETAESRERLDPVRVAMQWVATDPAARAALSQPSQSDEPALRPPMMPAVRSAGVVVEQVEIAGSDSPPAAERRSRSNASEPAIRTIPLAPAPRWRDEERRPDNVRATGDRRVWTADDEIVEISIGAINLHVEAPPQTVVQSPPARPQQPASTPRRERSGLSRKYLRSF